MVVDYSTSTLWNPWFNEKNTPSKKRFDTLLKILQYVYKKGVLLLCWGCCRQKCLVLDYLASLFFYSVVFYFIFTYSTWLCWITDCCGTYYNNVVFFVDLFVCQLNCAQPRIITVMIQHKYFTFLASSLGLLGFFETYVRVHCTYIQEIKLTIHWGVL